jgi:transcriptional regulator with XRE-family HTH domain
MSGKLYILFLGEICKKSENHLSLACICWKKTYNSNRGETMINDTIKSLREAAGISQAALAKQLSVTRSSVNAWELGLSVPTTQYIVELAKFFCVSSDYLLGLTNQETLVLDDLTDSERQILRLMIQYFIQQHQ